MFDLSDYRLVGKVDGPGTDKPILPRNDSPRRALGRGFLKGPVPLDWLAAAAQLPGKALTVAVLIRYRSGLQRATAELTLPGKLLTQFGIGRNALYRGLEQLERAKLIEIERRRGRMARIAIVERVATK